ncbi:type II toxin-antitoxin system Phd/YefM family antitoxin [Sphingomonas cavernae]|uniref:Antitoxin n=1 Tax=Sphingomonas cavernae TaxID=2320861 RepID=A0A418WKU8_9SPHN|nr:type II toxin-antitoxin system prevent-host-death family antitoxin [Sphingomonas cavernae]RJF90640.1 type II toxin-antitoxin system prevent-host-death family antitoxin [Sphingomonas cavernae]
MEISVSDAKGQLSELIRRAEAGDEIILTRYGQAAVRLVPVKPMTNQESRRALLDAMRASAAEKAAAGPRAGRSQDFLYGDAGQRPPILEKHRWWSNPGLSDPDTVIATVLADPTTIDLARIIGTYGLSRVERVRKEISHELTSSEARWLETLWEPVILGVQDASRMPTGRDPGK